MNKKLSKVALILIALINIPYLLLLISGLEPNPVGSEIVAYNTRFVIIYPVILIFLCVAGLFVKEKHIDIYRKCSKIFAVLRVIGGEFGIFWLTFFQKKGDINPLDILKEADKQMLILWLGIVFLLFVLPLMSHIAVLGCFEYGLRKEMRMKNLRIYKILFICLLIVMLIAVSAMVIVNFQMMC